MEFIPDAMTEIDKGPNTSLRIRFDYLKSKEISEFNINSALLNLSKRKCEIINFVLQ